MTDFGAEAVPANIVWIEDCKCMPFYGSTSGEMDLKVTQHNNPFIHSARGVNFSLQIFWVID